jgi:hypothetical protein
MRGLIGPQSVNSLVSGVLIESAPLDNGESHEYRQFLGDLLEMRTQTLTLLTQPLHQFYKTRKVATHFWFDPHVEQTMHHQPEGSERDNTWNVTMGFIQDELKKQKVWFVDRKENVVNLSFCLFFLDRHCRFEILYSSCWKYTECF